MSRLSGRARLPEPIEGTMDGTMALTLRGAAPADLPAVAALLEAAALPTAGVADWLPRFVVAEADGGVVGVAGLEVYGAYGLLRSVAVAGPWRGRGVGAAMTDRLLDVARSAGLRSVYLLTTTAESYFPRHGFHRIERAAVADPVMASAEFGGACPATATVMVLDLDAEAR